MKSQITERSVLNRIKTLLEKADGMNPALRERIFERAVQEYIKAHNESICAQTGTYKKTAVS